MKKIKSKKRICLIGVNHDAQRDKDSPEAEVLRDDLVNFVRNHNSIDLIAEELSKKFLVEKGVEKSTPQEVAEIFGIKHKLCDPDSREREKLGISKEQLHRKFGFKSAINGTEEWKGRKSYEWPIRESEWLKRINSTKARNVIFVCGSDHLESFKFTLIENGYVVLTNNHNAS